MKIILLKDVAGQGRRGDVIDVAEGYARNYLIPRGMASQASKGMMKELDNRRQSTALKEERLEKEARELAARLKNVTVVVKAKTGEGGRIFGSVNHRDITETLDAQHNIKLDKKKLVLKEPIKQLGVYSITAKLHPGVQVEIGVQVVGEEK